MKNIFAENLRGLRKLTGFTQTEFAYELNIFALKCGLVTEGVELFGKGKKKICNLENGNQEPRLTDIEIISRYFKISPAELIYKKIDKNIDFLRNINFNFKVNPIFLPIFTVSDEDELFSNAYKQHYNILFKEREPSKESFLKCLQSYIVAWENGNKRIEAIANYVSLLLYKYCCLIESVNVKAVDFKNINAVFGQNIESEILQNKREYANNPYIEYYLDLLQKSKFSDLIDFFIFASYFFCFVKNNDDFLSNRDFAINYLDLLLIKENKYAELFLLFFIKVYNCNQAEDISSEEVDELIEEIIDDLKQEGIFILNHNIAL